MALTVTMPQLGESVTEGTIARWLKQPGDAIERYESIAEVVTDKVNAEIPAPAQGVMGEHIVTEGTVVAVGEAICVIEGAEEAAAAPSAAKSQEPVPVAAPAVASGATTPSTPAPPAPAPVATAPQVENTEPMHVTPIVRALAREHGVDLTRVPGTGIGGRVSKRDVLVWIEKGGAAPAPANGHATGPAAPVAGAAAAAAAPTAPAVVPRGEDSVTPLSPVRRSIAEHMVRSRHASPHAWVAVEVDMSRIVAERTRQRASFKAQHGVDLTYLPFVAEATVAALRQYPSLNTSWSDEGIIQRAAINLGIAVALEDNLVVPVLHNADHLSLAGLATGLADLTERARGSRLRIDDIQGGTFTLNNAGALRTVMSQAIINQPQAAIMVMDGIVKRAVVIDDAIAIRPIMNLSLSFDHRLNDGLHSARFINYVKKLLEGGEA